MKFGTDGIRDVVGSPNFTPQNLAVFGEALAIFIAERGGIEVIVASDTRESSEFIKHSLVGGILNRGVNVIDCGIVPTGLVAFLTEHFSAGLGIVITASHNPPYYNGIKIFRGNGFKLNDFEEVEIEDIYSNVHLKSSKTGHFGRYRQIDVKNTCLRFLNNLFYEQNLNKLKIVIDCAHGSNFSFAPVVFEHLGAEVIAIGANPDGRNINETGCMNPNKCVEVCGEVKADFGLCFDGDGDRCLVCTSNQIFDGDWTLAVLTKFRQYVFTNNLNGVVGTVISNSALGALCQAEGVEFTRAPVGDVNVLSEMLKNGFNLGGEPAGHTILLEKAKFGDGLVTGLALAIVLNSIKQENGDLQCIRGFYSPYPQKHFNFPVEFRKPLSEFDDLNRAIIDAEKEGMRIVVRYSGTENALRLTIEGRYDEEIEMHYSRIKRILIENKLIKS